MIKTIKQWLNAAADVVLPRVCPVCRQALDSDERWLCRQCLAALPRTRYEEVEFNTMEQHFAGKVPIERATAYFFYEKGSPYAAILHDIKYRSTPLMGRWLTARGWCAYTTRGNTRADALATSLYTAAQAIAIASSPFIFANEEMAIPTILYSLMMNVVLLIYVGVVRKRQ